MASRQKFQGVRMSKLQLLLKAPAEKAAMVAESNSTEGEAEAQGNTAQSSTDLTTTSTPTAKHQPTTITNLPNEVLGLIFECFDTVSSACIGITCKVMYAQHMRIRPRVRLHTSPDFPLHNHTLWKALQAWMAPRRWCPRKARFFQEETVRCGECGCYFCAQIKGVEQDGLNWLF